MIKSKLMIEKVDRVLGVASGAASMALISDSIGWSERKKRLGCIESKSKRFAALAIHNAVKTSPKLVRDMLARPYEKRDMEVVGMGYCSTVIRMGNTAVKLLRASDRLSESEQTEYIKQLELSQAVLLDYLPEFALPQDFEITEHPFKSRSVIIAKQSFVEGYIPLRINNSDAFTHLDVSQKRQVGDFTDQALEMIEGSGLAPDLLGADNIGFTQDGNSLVMVDTIPVRVKKTTDMSVQYINRVSVAVQ